jgi:CMP/dCMP kinase
MAVITVSRQYGSGGDDIANRVSVILGYRYFDKNLLVEIAEQVGLSREEIVDASEEYHRVPGRLDALFGGSRSHSQPRAQGDAGAAGLGDLQALDESERVALVEGLLHVACKQDDIVIVGRGGQALFQGVANVLNVRVEAPLETRIQRVQEQERLNESAARARIAERDAAAADYLRRFYKIDWTDRYLYHLWLNTGLWDIESAAHIVAAAASCLPLRRHAAPPVTGKSAA